MRYGSELALEAYSAITATARRNCGSSGPSDATRSVTREN